MSRGCFSDSDSLPKESSGQIPLQCNVEVSGDTTGILTLSLELRKFLQMTVLLFKNTCFFSFSHLLKNQIISGCFFFILQLCLENKYASTIPFFFFFFKNKLPHQISDNEIVWATWNNLVLLIWHLNPVFGSASEPKEKIYLSRCSVIFKP